MTASPDTRNQPVPSSAMKTSTYLTFSLADEDYGIEILKVKEIIGMMAVTSVPWAPVFVKGVINLRGKVIPVIDLRLKFDMGKISHTDKTCIIVVEIKTEKGPVFIGIAVDSVSDVLHISENEVEKAPDTRMDTDCITGTAKTENGVKILLHIDNILSRQDLSNIRKTTREIL